MRGGGQSPRGRRVHGPPDPSSGQKKINSFPLTVKLGHLDIRHYFIETLTTGRLVVVGETFNRFADFGCKLHKMRLAAARTRWGAVALPRPPREGKGWEYGGE